MYGAAKGKVAPKASIEVYEVPDQKTMARFCDVTFWFCETPAATKFFEELRAGFIGREEKKNA